MAHEFILYIKPGRSTIDVLQYLNNNIQIINEMGVYINIKKWEDLTKVDMRNLRKYNITKLPSLLADSGKVFTGYNAIQSLFDDNINQYITVMQTEQMQEKKAIIDGTISLHDYTFNALQMDQNEGKGSGEEEEFGGEGPIKSEDYGKRIREMNEKRSGRSSSKGRGIIGNNNDNNHNGFDAGGGNEAPLPINRGNARSTAPATVADKGGRTNIGIVSNAFMNRQADPMMEQWMAKTDDGGTDLDYPGLDDNIMTF